MQLWKKECLSEKTTSNGLGSQDAPISVGEDEGPGH